MEKAGLATTLPADPMPGVREKDMVARIPTATFRDWTAGHGETKITHWQLRTTFGKELPFFLVASFDCFDLKNLLSQSKAFFSMTQWLSQVRAESHSKVVSWPLHVAFATDPSKRPRAANFQQCGFGENRMTTGATSSLCDSGLFALIDGEARDNSLFGCFKLCWSRSCQAKDLILLDLSETLA